MKRITAAVVAIVLVVVALVIRSQRDHEKTLGPYRLVCATEFADACRSLDAKRVAVTIEPAGVTADRLDGVAAGTDPGFDGWLAAGPWATMVEAARRNSGAQPITGNPEAVGVSKVAVAVWRDRARVLRTACGGALSWKCLGDAAARDKWTTNGGDAAWGDVKVAIPDPGIESAGLQALAAATEGFIGNANLVPTDLAANDAYQHWLVALARAIPKPTPDLGAILAQGPAAADVYVGLDANVSSLVNASARRSDVEVVYLSPVFNVVAMIATTGKRAGINGELSSALSRAGWKAVPESAPSPASGPLAGLRRMWQDTVR